MNLSRLPPPTFHALAHGSFCALESFPHRDDNDIPEPQRTSQKERSQALSLLSTRKVLMSSRLCVLVHHSESRLGSMSRSTSSSMVSFTMQIIFSLLSLISQQMSAQIIPRITYSCHAVLRKVALPALWLSPFLQLSKAHTWLHASRHRGFHPSLTNAPRILHCSVSF